MKTAADLPKLLAQLADAGLTIAAVRLVHASNGWACTVGEMLDHRVQAVIRPEPTVALVEGLLDFFRRRELEKDLDALI